MYKLLGIFGRTFVKEELMNITYDTVSPHDWFLRGDVLSKII